MITTAFVLAACTVACAVLLFIKLPKTIKRFFLKHQLLTDTLATAGTWLTLSSISASLIAALASAMSGVSISGLLYMQGQKEERKNVNRR